MDYIQATQILNQYIFHGEKRNLLIKLAENPERYVGVFRPTKPRTKLIQNLLQSQEIRFGDAIEILIREIIVGWGFTNLSRELKFNDENKLSLDQFFTDGQGYYLIEQKIRDDHDSTKKRGQVRNFEEKISTLYKVYHKKLIGIIYFIDPSATKNKNYYIQEIERLRKIYNIELYLFYGKDFFDYFNHSTLWENLNEWFTRWRDSLTDIPEINFDMSPRTSFEEIKTIPPVYWKKLLDNDTLWKDGIIRVLFGDGTTLKLLFSYFSQQQSNEYHSISQSLLSKINKYYY